MLLLLPKEKSALLWAFFDVCERDVSNATLDSAVVRPVQAVTLHSLLLIDALFLRDKAEGAFKTNADVERHHSLWTSVAVDAYTSDESHRY